MSTSFDPSVLFQQAIAYHQSGDINAAIKIYKWLVARYPNNSGLLTNFGTALLQLGQCEESIKLLKKSLALDSNQPTAWSNQGIALKNLKKLKESLASFDCAIALQPSYADAYSNKGNALTDLGQFSEALNAFDKAISLRPNYADAYNNKGNVLRELKRFEDAVDSFNKAISLRPNYADAYNNKGNVLRELKRFEDAVDSFNKAISLRPDYADAYYNLSMAFHESKKFHRAIECSDEAIKYNPVFADAYVCRGLAHHKLNQFSIALEDFNHALQLDPYNFEGFNNQGLSLCEMDDYSAAIDAFNMALKLKPNNAEVYNNLGMAFQSTNNLDEALNYFDKSVFSDPELADAHWNKSLLHLLRSEYAEGWKLYEFRWKTKSLNYSFRNYEQPLWLGRESLSGKTILIWSEQGLGDAIQFCRYIKMVTDLGAKVIFEVQKPLLESLSTLEGISEIIPMGAQSSNFDFHCPLLSLPLAFKTTVETIPKQIPYLNPDPNKVAYWKEKLGKRTNLRIGLVWSSGHRPNQPEVWSFAQKKNIPLSKLERLNLSHIDFYSLQKGKDAEDQLISLKNSNWNGLTVIDFTDQLHDFSDTAALIANLDLVISVDTSVAHMAGAMGKPVWVLSQFNTDWRWMDGQRESWYPTATVFNQSSHGNWDSVVESVRNKLIELLNQS